NLKTLSRLQADNRIKAPVLRRRWIRLGSLPIISNHCVDDCKITQTDSKVSKPVAKDSNRVNNRTANRVHLDNKVSRISRASKGRLRDSNRRGNRRKTKVREVDADSEDKDSVVSRANSKVNNRLVSKDNRDNPASRGRLVNNDRPDNKVNPDNKASKVDRDSKGNRAVKIRTALVRTLT